MWGGGGGGEATSGSSNSVGGGGGGGYKQKWFSASELGATETITIGVGGSAGVAAPGTFADGGHGGNTTFGSHLTAYGGEGGGVAANNNGGRGGREGGGEDEELTGRIVEQ